MTADGLTRGTDGVWCQERSGSSSCARNSGRISRFQELVEAALSASPERQGAALRVLMGEVDLAELVSPPTTTEAYLTGKQLAEEMAVSLSTLWRWGVPGCDLGGRKRYRRSEVEQYLRSEGFARRQASLRAERRMRRKEAA